MPDEPTKPSQANTPVPPATSAKPAVAPATPPDIGHMPMSEEFDSAKWTLPPIVPVLIAAAAVAIIVAIVMFTNRPTPTLSGSIAKVAAADMDANTLVAVKLQLNNVIDKQIWIKGV